MRNSKINEKLKCDPALVERILEKQGYRKRDNNYFKKTRYGRIHVIMSAVKNHGCRIMIHHDLVAFGIRTIKHYTKPYDPYPWWAWKDIESAVYAELRAR